jgi:chemosensory pili system protein ChpA (sensor histidine kinase/response regulator)
MITDDEKQVRLQFLDEAQEYIEKLESGLLGLSQAQVVNSKQIEPAIIDPVLRAAHSIKGGAAMMGFTLLSELAHRLEDSFKVLQYGRNVNVDITIEQNLLAAVDRLSEIINYLKQGKSIEEQWLKTHVHPIFDFLLDRLGTPNAEDQANLLSEEVGEDLVSLLFNTEVEQALEKLEVLTQTPQQSNLRSELQITAEELAGLGEMLDLPVFTQLSQEILNCIHHPRMPIVDLSNQAIAAWRQSQALIITGQQNYLSNVLNAWIEDNSSIKMVTNESLDDGQTWLSSNDLPTTGSSKDSTFVPLDYIPDSLNTEEIQVLSAFWAQTSGDTLQPSTVIDLPDLIVPNSDFTEDAAELFAAIEELPDSFADDSSSLFKALDDIISFEDNTGSLPTIEGFNLGEDTSGQISADLFQEASALFLALENIPEPAIDEHHHSSSESPSSDKSNTISVEQTIRVPIRQIDLLGDLFGELIIERNALGLQLKNSRQLLEKLSNKVKELEISNYQLRQNYDSRSIASNNQGITNYSNIRNYNKSLDHQNISENNDLQWLLEDQELIDSLEELNLISKLDNLELDQYDENHLLAQDVMDNIVQIQELYSDLDLNLTDTERLSRDIYRTAELMQTSLVQVRMRPLSEIFQRFPRAIRDLSHRHQKPVDLHIRGGHILVERSVLEALNDPLLHIIRNAFDHGIESQEIRMQNGKPLTGNIEINAFYRGNKTIITIKDDGKGISIEKIRQKAKKLGLDEKDLENVSESDLLNMIFEPGFSTADQVTDLSGRGVGMDVVRTNVQEINGDIQVQTFPNQGATFTISVPFNLSITRILLVEVKGNLIAVPSNLVEEVLLSDTPQIMESPGEPVLYWDGLVIRLVDTQQYLVTQGINHQVPQEMNPMINQPCILLIENGEELIGLKVDRFWFEEEVTIRQPQQHLKLPHGFVGCTILGDGRIVPLLDPLQLVQGIDQERINPKDRGIFTKIDRNSNIQNINNLPSSQKDRPLVLVIDDSINVRRFVSLVLEKAGYQTEEARDGQDAADKLQNGLKPQVIISDVEMPRMDGYGFLAFIKSNSRYSKIPVIMLTSRSGEKHRKIAMNLGAKGYFCKPFKEQELLVTLDNLVVNTEL